MSDSPQNPWTSPNKSPDPPKQRRLPPTPGQRRLGARIGIGVILAALAVIILLDRFGIIH